MERRSQHITRMYFALTRNQSVCIQYVQRYSSKIQNSWVIGTASVSGVSCLFNELQRDGNQRLRTAKLWNTETGSLQRALMVHSDLVWSVAFSRDGRLLASGSDDMTIRLWDPTTGALQQTPCQGPDRSLHGTLSSITTWSSICAFLAVAQW
jgi:WD40 repeat protein